MLDVWPANMSFIKKDNKIWIEDNNIKSTFTFIDLKRIQL